MKKIINQNRIRVLSVTSGKGGVGKTNIVANIALALRRMGKRVVILDADLGLGNIDILLGIVPKYNISHVFDGSKTIHEVLMDGPEGIKMISAVSGLFDLTPLGNSEKIVLISQLDQLENDFDFMLIDTAAGISSNVMYFNTAAQQIIVVTSPEPTSITDAYALIRTLSKNYNEKRFNLIVNLVSGYKEAFEIYQRILNIAMKYLDISIDFLGFVAFDNNVTESVKKQSLFLQKYPLAPASKNIQSIATKVNNLEASGLPKGNLQFFLKSTLKCRS